MTTTVTTVTVSTVTAMGLAGALGFLGIILVVALLMGKEVVSTSPDSRAKNWGRTLNIGLIPVMLSFAVIVAARFGNMF